jgi:hypothetical protein
MNNCPIRGEATVVEFDGGVRWIRTDPEIHVTDELLASPDARQGLEAVYVIGESCPHATGMTHARLRTPL